uniref:PPPDE domain-containing protein n=1 Tax=Globodera rostochiensis TaxID=31243 RepID=A0A914GUX2_GLORO
MHQKNSLFLFISALFWPIFECEVEIELNLNQIGGFVAAVQQPFFRQIALNDQSPTGAHGEDKNWIKKLGDELDKIGQKFGVTLLIEEVNKRISNAGHLIAKKSNEFCENLNEKRCREKERETRARLTVRELTILARRIVKYKILKQFFWEGNSGGAVRAKFSIWWYRFRYRVASAVTFDDNVSGNQIRLGIVQYYYGVHDELMELVKKIDQNLSFFEEVLTNLDKDLFTISIKTDTVNDEQSEFDPVAELPQDKAAVLMAKPKRRKVPVYVLCERFPIRLNIGAFGQAVGIEHRGVKVYDIEFHFGSEDGTLISDKMRIRGDTDRGVTFTLLGWTRKSQWEVQKIYDQFNDVSVHNGQFKEGEFGLNKYDLCRNNCIHFVKAFVEMLLEAADDRILKVGDRKRQKVASRCSETAVH